MRPVAFVCGTRPDTLKIAPVYLECRRQYGDQAAALITTGQHHELLDQALSAFDLRPDIRLNARPRGDEGLNRLLANVILETEIAYKEIRPGAVMVQGDTISTVGAAMAAFQLRIPVGHVEAGLRTGQLDAPFPEEANRRLVATLASYHFAPTIAAAEALASEGVTGSVRVTGNTIVDAVRLIRKRLSSGSARTELRVVATAHRRESWSGGIRAICEGLLGIVRYSPAIWLKFSYHPNPAVADVVKSVLGDHPRIELLPPVTYIEMLRILNESDLVVTDSGGLQEEASCFGLPVVITRAVTERPEIVESGFGIVAGADSKTILEAARFWIDAPERREAVRGKANPFGDGHASERCIEALGTVLR